MKIWRLFESLSARATYFSRQFSIRNLLHDTLDSHAAIWWFEDNSKLSAEARDAISDSNNIVFISAAAVWEITIKKSLGKLTAPDNIEEEINRHDMEPLPVTIPHALAVAGLPQHHNDPFDRIQAAQAILEGLTLVTRDSNLKKYDIPIIVA